MNKTNLQGMTIEELKSFAAEIGEKPFRGKQLFRWINRGVKDFERMTDFSGALREKLANVAYVGGVRVLNTQKDSRDGTVKFLFGIEDKKAGSIESAVEGVFMKYRYGNSLCVSSQVGCRMGCVFCASALGGFIRNLTAGEMVDQIFAAESFTGEKVNHVVVMGMGEPLDNYENLKKFLHIIHDPEGKNLGYRNITVSTSGIIPVMKEFAMDFPQVNLAISLHRPDDAGRSRIMPVNKAYPIDELLRAVKGYTKTTGRRITFEYALIKGENDDSETIALLKEKLSGMLCHVNLIPLNKVDETGLIGSSRRRAGEIAEELERAGIAATVRRELGDNIDGACGQLRMKQTIKE